MSTGWPVWSIGPAGRRRRTGWEFLHSAVDDHSRLAYSEIHPVEDGGSSRERAATLPAWLHTYNHHRSHTSLDGQPPISRVSDLPGQYS